ncbi:hypothetical protein GGR53DRAFT_462455 [Hypoxylon sp. FL1150]|nr:hypothetical protein GGR53DRAFT_462455 [Hypoxylon sp. FL1150]
MSNRDIAERIREDVSDTINEALIGHIGDRVTTSAEVRAKGGDTGGLSHLYGYTRWVVKRDLTVTVDDNSQDDPIWWHDVEITTPALYATEKSYDEVRTVIKALIERWWIWTPNSAALHIHYGRGTDYIPFNHLRKIGAFLFCGDPILSQMHTTNHRDETGLTWSPSNRYYSNIAHGMSAGQARRICQSRQDGQDVGIEGERVHFDVAAYRREIPPEERNLLKKGRVFPTVFERGELPGYVFNDHEYEVTLDAILATQPMEERAKGASNTQPISIPMGVLEILWCQSCPMVSMLHENYANGRAAYNFQLYGYDYKTRGAVFEGTKRTIEFRQPQGTIDPDEVLAHVKISVTLADFASRMSYNELYKWAIDMTSAEKTPEWYDVIDVLFDLGLAREAYFIERYHARDQGIVIPEEVERYYGVAANFAPLAAPRGRRLASMRSFVRNFFRLTRDEQRHIPDLMDRLAHGLPENE